MSRTIVQCVFNGLGELESGPHVGLGSAAGIAQGMANARGVAVYLATTEISFNGSHARTTVVAPERK